MNAAILKEMSIGLLALTVTLLPSITRAQSWPDKPVRVIVPVAAGTSNDLAARLIGDKLSGLWGQQVVVENLGGAGGIPGVNALVRARPDGYTFGFLPGSVVMVTPVLYRSAKFDVERDLVPVAPIAVSPFMIVVNAKSEIQSMADLVREARANPGRINMAALPINTAVHLGAVMLNSVAGIALNIVPYKGASDALLSVVSGQTQVAIGGVPAVVPLMKDGRLRVISVTTRERLPGYEHIPSSHDAVPGFELNSWFGLFAPAGTPGDVVTRVNRDVNSVLKLPDITAKFVPAGIYVMAGSPATLKALIETERPVWAKIAREAGVMTD